MTARFTHEFRSEGEAPTGQEIAAQLFGTPSEEEAEQEADAFLAMFIEASLSPQQMLQYLDGAPWPAPRARQDDDTDDDE